MHATISSYTLTKVLVKALEAALPALEAALPDLENTVHLSPFLKNVSFWHT